LAVLNGIVSGLVNYWPITNGKIVDTVGGMNPTSVTPTFIADRFGNANGAIRISNSASCWRLPNQIYLSNDFTVTLWIIVYDCTTNNILGKVLFNLSNSN
jgi:hypothetical protein